MPTETSISTQIPSGTKPEAVIACLHDHEQYIRITCPQLISFKHLEGTPEIGSTDVYEITDKRPIGQTTFKYHMVNQPDGIDALVDGKTPTGPMKIHMQWRVSGNTLTESVVIDANILMNKMIKGNVEKAHPEQHQGFIAEAAKA